MRAIICDDDKIILNGLCSVIDWESLGVTIVGTAENGRDGIRLLQEQQPDLLMTDIRMPHVDGLKMIEEGKKINSKLMAGVFSGYDDFEYARKALKLGVEDYLSKPIPVDELIGIVSRCVQKFRHARENDYQELEHQIRKLLMYEDTDNVDVTASGQSWGSVLIAELPEGMTPCAYEQHMKQTETIIRNLGGYILSLKNNYCEAAFICHSKMSTEIRVQECIRQIRKALKPEGLSITCAVSSARYGLKEVSRCYQEAQEVLKLKYVRGENQDLYYQDIENETGHSYPEDILKTDLITPLKIGDTDALKKRLNELNLHLQKTGNDSYLYLQFIVGNLYSSLFQELSRDGISAKLIFEDPVEEYRKLLNCNTIQKAIAVLSDNLMRVCQYIMAQKQQSYSPPVLKALQYITANSQTPTLSLDDISDNVGLSSGRFSTLFKTETGMTFTDYLLKTRMEKAKELMLNPNKKIYEIALESGYDNIPYFSTAFRKYTGYSPSEYRNQIR